MTAIDQVRRPTARGGTASLLGDTAVLTRRGFEHWARNPGPVVFSLLFNVLIVLMFLYVFGGAMQVPNGGEYRDFLLPGMFTMTMVFGVAMTTAAVMTDVQRGVVDRFRSMPMASSAVLLGRALVDMAFSVVALMTIWLAALAVGWRAQGSGSDLLKAIGLLLLLRFALIWVGVYLGLAFSTPEALTGVQTLEFPIGFLSSVFVATSTMPGWLGTLSDWNPLSSTATALRQLFGSPGVVGGSWITDNAQLTAVVWPLIILGVFLPLSIATFRRMSR